MLKQHEAQPETLNVCMFLKRGSQCTPRQDDAREESLSWIYLLNAKGRRTRKVGLRETHETETRLQPWHGPQVLFAYKNIPYRAANTTAVQGEWLCPKYPPGNYGCVLKWRDVS